MQYSPPWCSEAQGVSLVLTSSTLGSQVHPSNAHYTAANYLTGVALPIDAESTVRP